MQTYIAAFPPIILAGGSSASERQFASPFTTSQAGTIDEGLQLVVAVKSSTKAQSERSGKLKRPPEGGRYETPCHWLRSQGQDKPNDGVILNLRAIDNEREERAITGLILNADGGTAFY